MEARLSEPSDSRLAEAEKVFTVGGFLTGVLPLILVLYAAWSGILWFMTDLKTSDIGGVAIFIAPLFLTALPQLVRYTLASDAHHAFKKKYGDLYEDKIRRGEMSLSVASIMLNGAPNRYKSALESSAHTGGEPNE